MMINKITFTGREDMLVDAIRVAAEKTPKVQQEIVPYITESTIIPVSVKANKNVSMFNPIGLVDVAVPKAENVAEAVAEGPHLNYFG